MGRKQTDRAADRHTEPDRIRQRWRNEERESERNKQTARPRETGTNRQTDAKVYLIGLWPSQSWLN